MRAPPPITDLPRFPVTGGTILLAIAVTIASTAKVDVSALFVSALVQRGEVWRLVTSTLPHANVLHLLFNAYWTWVFGTLLEQTIGSLRTLGLFLLLATGSMAAEFAVLNGGIGLSGVGYGLFGIMWALSRPGIARYDGRFRDAVDQNTIVLFLVWFVICIFTTVSGALPVANVAHGAGLLGLGVGFAIGAPHPTARRVAAVGVGTSVAVLLLLATLFRPYVNFSAVAAADNAYQGWQALDAQRNDEAVWWLQNAVRMQPRNGGTWTNLGIAYSRTGRATDALAAFARAESLPRER